MADGFIGALAGSAWIAVKPSFQGFAKAVETESVSAGRSGGARLGKAYGDAAEQAAAPSLRKLGADVGRAKAAEADAAGKVRVAEARLQEVRDSGRAKASQLAAAEEGLAKANRGLQAATDRTRSATDDYKRAQDAAARQADDARQSQDRLGKAYVSAGRDADRAEADTRRLDKAMDQADGRAGGLARSMGGAAKAFGALAVAAAGAAAISFGKGAIEQASDLEQSVGGVAAVFKDQAAAIDAVAIGADRALGLSRNSYNELATVLGAGLKNKGIATFADDTQRLIGLGADLAAQFGGSTQEAVEAIASALRGESDPIEKYGISLNEAAINAELLANGQSKLTGSALEQAKAQARLKLLFGQSADAQGAFAREADTAAGRAQRAGAQWENFQAVLGEKLLPVVSDVADWFGTQALPAVEGFFASLESGEGPVGSISTALGKLKAGAELFISGDFTRAIGDTLGLEEDSGPVRAILTIRDAITGVFNLLASGDYTGALRRAFGLEEDSPLVQKVLGLRDAVGGLFSSVRGAAERLLPVVSDVWSQLVERAQPLLPKVRVVVETLVDIISTGVQVVSTFISRAVDVIVWLWELWGEDLVNVVTTAFNAVLGIVQPVLDLIRGVFGFFLALLQGDWSGVWEALQSIVRAAGDLIVGIVQGALDLVVAILGAAWTVIKAAASAAWDGITGVLSAAWDAIWSRVTAVWTLISDWFVGIWDTIRESAFVQALVQIRDFMAGVWDAIWSRIWSVWETVSGFLRSQWDGLVNLVQWAAGLWRDFLSGVWDAIWSRISAVWTAISDWFSVRWAVITGVFSAAAEWVTSVLSAAWDAVWSRVSAAWTAISDFFWSRWEAIKQIVWSGVDWVRSALSGVWDAITNKVRETWDGIIEWLSLRWEAIKQVASDAWNGVATAIGGAWEKVKELLLKPIQFVVETVINQGIIDNYNKLISTLGIPLQPIGRLPVPRLGNAADERSGDAAHAGRWWTGGYTGPGGKFQKAGDVHAGEFVIRQESTHQIMSSLPGLLEAMNAEGMAALDRLGVPGYAGGGLVAPVPGTSSGWRSYPGHTGIDYPVGTGTPVHAALDGIVNAVKHLATSYGNHVRISHAGGLETIYAHLSRTLAQIGQQVSAGQVIGLSGSTGNSTGPHLHFEVRDSGRPVNPLQYLSGAVQPGDGGGGNPLTWALEGFRTLVNGVIDNAPLPFRDSSFGQIGVGVARKALNGIVDWLAEKVSFSDAVAEAGGRAQQWSGLASQALARAGLPQSLLPLMLHRIDVESGGNPRAVNLWDSNARRGDPSKGLMQVIGSTFAAYRDRSLANDPFDPLANMMAAINYTRAAYRGDFDRAWSGRSGYADGGLVQLPARPLVFDRGGYLPVTRPGEFVPVQNLTGRPEPLARVGAGGVDGTTVIVNTQTTSTAGEVANEVLWGLRHARRGGRYARAGR